MVNDTSKALSHPTRRGIFENLATGPVTVVLDHQDQALLVHTKQKDRDGESRPVSAQPTGPLGTQATTRLASASWA